MSYTTEQIHQAIHAAALDYWLGNHEDVDGSPFIEGLFASTGWGSWVKDGYENKNPKFYWCGHFAGSCMLRIGDFVEAGQCVPVFIDRDIPLYCTPSTSRLNNPRKWKQATEIDPWRYKVEDGLARPFMSDGRGVGVGKDLENVLIPGAIATMVTRAGKEYGDHVIVIDEYNGGDTFTTIEGNGHGEFPTGKRGEGVIRTTRKVEDLRRVYLLSPLHLETI